MTANHQSRLDQMVEVHGPLSSIPWQTATGDLLTIGEMSDEHLENSRNYHRLLGDLAEHESGVHQRRNIRSPDIWANTLSDCRFNEFLMIKEQERRSNQSI